MAKWPVCCGVDLKADSEGKELNFNKKQAIYSGWWKNTKANGKIKQEEKKNLSMNSSDFVTGHLLQPTILT